MSQIKTRHPDKVEVQVVPPAPGRRVAAPSAAKLAFFRARTNTDPTWHRD